MNSLFDLIEDQPGGGSVANDDWRPESPPDLSGEDNVIFNFETNGLKWFDGDLPIALSIYAKGRSWYLPFGHRGAGNLDEKQVYRFAQSLKGKRLGNINTRFDIHMGREWGKKMGDGGLDFDEMGCTVFDVGHYGALLDDHRFHLNLDSLITDYLGEKPMVRLDESRMASYSAGAAQTRARYNVEAVHRLNEVMRPKMTEQNLDKVRKLEEEVIFVVCEMEKQGTLIDVELLEKWLIETKTRYNKLITQMMKETGLAINPNSSPDQAKLFKLCKIPITEFTDKGGPSFTDEVIKHIQHPHIKLLRKCKKMKSLHSKLQKYQTSIDGNNILRYALHQLRMSKDESADSRETGTVTGRFTSTEIVEGIGVNIQQVLKPEKQLLTYGDEFFVRDLHIAPPDLQFLSIDAEQIQYRLFAHEANNPRVIQAYVDDPSLSFHKMMWALLRQYKPDLTYKRTKDTNFAKVFAAGLVKICLMLEFINKREYNELKGTKGAWSNPKLAKGVEILKLYDREVPEVKKLLENASNLAKTRGYISTILGRRSRFFGEREHKALNMRIQGSEADIIKTKAVELHKNRKYTGYTLCWQVHDEFDGYVPDEQAQHRIEEILNRQSFKLRVPILFKGTLGKSWGDTARDEIKKIREEQALDKKVA